MTHLNTSSFIVHSFENSHTVQDEEWKIYGNAYCVYYDIILSFFIWCQQIQCPLFVDQRDWSLKIITSSSIFILWDHEVKYYYINFTIIHQPISEGILIQFKHFLHLLCSSWSPPIIWYGATMRKCTPRDSFLWTSGADMWHNWTYEMVVQCTWHSMKLDWAYSPNKDEKCSYIISLSSSRLQEGGGRISNLHQIHLQRHPKVIIF